MELSTNHNYLLALLGDIHGRWKLAYDALDRLERERNTRIDQVISVGDLGLFLLEEDWGHVTGPRKHRHPEWSPEIREVWQAWRWPTAAIGGNHEPWNRLRVFDSGYFAHKLTYTNAGVLQHQLNGLRVVGLSGIRGPDDSFHSEASWLDRWKAVRSGLRPRKLLAYYTQSDLEIALRSGPAHLLLTHDWPVALDPAILASLAAEPRIALEHLSPAWHFCGHHHRAHQLTVGTTAVRALNTIAQEEGSHDPLPGWAWLGTWNGLSLEEIGYWPPLDTRAPEVESKVSRDVP